MFNEEMILDTVLIACNLNKNYYQYYPLCRLVWKHLVGLQPKLVLIADEIPPYLQPYKDEIILFPQFNNINTVFLAQVIREYFPCVMTESKGIIMSDADMLPMSRRYFLDPIQDCPQDKLVLYRHDVCNDCLEIPMCYVAGSCQAFRNVFKCETIDDIKREIQKLADQNEFDGQHGGKGWVVDQRNLFNLVQNHEPQSDLFRLTDQDTGHLRLDRWHNPNDSDVHAQMFTDYHMPRWLPQNWQHVYRIIRALLPDVELPVLEFD